MADYSLKISATNYAAATSFTGFYKLWYKKELNKVSEFKATLYDLSTAQKAIVKEGNLFYLFYDTTLILKGEIRNVDKEDTSEEWTIEGNGMEITLHDRAVQGRSQWDDSAADDIIKELISGIMSEGTIEAAIKVGFRAEEDSILRTVMALAQAIGWDWYVNQAVGYDTDQLNFVAHRGTSDSIVESFNAINDATNLVSHSDVDSVFNVVRVLGYGDGVNQLISEAFSSTANRATLSAEISATATSLTVTEAIDSFPATGDLRCGREWIKYSSKNNETKTFSGLTRGYIPGTNPPTDNPYYIAAYAHKKGAQIIDLQYSDGGFASYADAEAGSSIATYKIRENVYAEPSIMHQTTVDLLAQRLIAKYEQPVERVEFLALKEILDAAGIGDLVRIGYLDPLYPSATLYPSPFLYPGHVSKWYRLIALEFNEDEYAMQLTLGNAAGDFLEDISSLQKTLDISSVYGLGNTVMYSGQSYENCDASHPLHIRFFLPPELVAINHVYLNFKIKQYRAYTGTTPSGGGHTTPSGGGHTTPSGGGHTTPSGGGHTTPSGGGGTSGATPSGTSGYLITNLGVTSAVADDSHTHTVENGSTGGPSSTVQKTRIISYTTGYWTDIAHTHSTPNHTHDVSDHQHTVSSHTHTVSDHQHTVSNHTHGMTYEIYEASETSPSIIVKVGEDGGSLTEVSGSPFSTDQTKLDITELVKAIGTDAWIDIECTPNQARRIEATYFIQAFIESK